MGKGAELFVAALENEGVERIFGVPGEENLDFLEALRTSAIELVLTRHEQAAAFMAATCGRITGKPGVCLSTLGPGALNFTTGAAYAHLGAMPMVLITGQKAVRSARQARFQLVDIVGTMRPLTKMARQSCLRLPFPASFVRPLVWLPRSGPGPFIWSSPRTSRPKKPAWSSFSRTPWISPLRPPRRWTTPWRSSPARRGRSS